MAGDGRKNSSCVVCYAPIERTEVEYEITLGELGTVVSHLNCYSLWRCESARQTGGADN